MAKYGVAVKGGKLNRGGLYNLGKRIGALFSALVLAVGVVPAFFVSNVVATDGEITLTKTAEKTGNRTAEVELNITSQPYTEGIDIVFLLDTSFTMCRDMENQSKNLCKEGETFKSYNANKKNDSSRRC